MILKLELRYFTFFLKCHFKKRKKPILELCPQRLDSSSAKVSPVCLSHDHVIDGRTRPYGTRLAVLGSEVGARRYRRVEPFCYAPTRRPVTDDAVKSAKQLREATTPCGFATRTHAESSAVARKPRDAPRHL